jgi:uncharacterized protein with NRDE domain
MCTVLLAWRCLPGAPIVLAANRDELIGRASAGPGVLVDSPRVVGGRDLVAGGTWLALSADGRVAAVTNRQAAERDPQRRSRGELPLLLLAAQGDAGAAATIRGLEASAYNPFNILYASPGVAIVGHGDAPAIRVVELSPGPHVLTVADVDDRSRPKVAWLAAGLEAAVAAATDATALLLAMEELLRDHGDQNRSGTDVACIHGDTYGTVSSSSVVVAASGQITYRHAPGRPCVTPHEDVSHLLA